MFFGEETVVHLKEVSTKIWNAPVDRKGCWYYIVNLVGCYEDFHVLTVRVFFVV
jgi:hypothetical protein